MKIVEGIAFVLFTFFVLMLVDRVWLPKRAAAVPRFRECRRSPRYAVHFPVTVAMPNGEAEGIIMDMSREGWRIESAHPVLAGMVLRLHIRLPSLLQPIPIEEAIVRWSNGREFGIELVRVNILPAAQLSDLFSLVERQATSPAKSTRRQEPLTA